MYIKGPGFGLALGPQNLRTGTIVSLNESSQKMMIIKGSTKQ
jgi:hypothetical protein